MSLTPDTIAEAAQMLRHAQATGLPVAPLRDTFPGLDANTAYAIQKLNTELKVEAGARIIGAKIGLTSPAVQRQLGVDSPDYGTLFDDMGYAEGLPIPMANLQQPKIEAEVAFVLGRDLNLQSPTIIDIINAIDYCLPALEIVGSRIDGWNIKLVDTVADNASSSAWVVGATPKKLHQLDLRGCAMTLTRDGDIVSRGSGAACLGHPLNAVLWLARTMARIGAPLKAGQLVLSGALGPMVTVEAGSTYTAEIAGLGSVTAVFE